MVVLSILPPAIVSQDSFDSPSPLDYRLNYLRATASGARRSEIVELILRYGAHRDVDPRAVEMLDRPEPLGPLFDAGDPVQERDPLHSRAGRRFSHWSGQFLKECRVGQRLLFCHRPPQFFYLPTTAILPRISSVSQANQRNGSHRVRHVRISSLRRFLLSRASGRWQAVPRGGHLPWSTPTQPMSRLSLGPKPWFCDVMQGMQGLLVVGLSDRGEPPRETYDAHKAPYRLNEQATVTVCDKRPAKQEDHSSENDDGSTNSLHSLPFLCVVPMPHS
jgi:hypothetical protein